MSLLVISCVLSWFMTGLIWFVQVVHYPMLAQLGEEGDDPRWPELHAAHVRRTTWVVLPAMFAEQAASIALFVARPSQVPVFLLVASYLLLSTAWASTFLVQVPLHGSLSRGPDATKLRRLVQTNWIRTAAWTCRSLLLTAACMLMFGDG